MEMGVGGGCTLIHPVEGCRGGGVAERFMSGKQVECDEVHMQQCTMGTNKKHAQQCSQRNGKFGVQFLILELVLSSLECSRWEVLA